MPKMVCVKCEVEFRPEENGILLAEMFQNNEKIYKVWSADLWKCPVCGNKVVAGFADRPIAEHFERDLEGLLEEEAARGTTIIKDKELLPKGGE